MDAKLHSTLESTTKILSALKQTHTLISRTLLPVYGEIISTKKELARYVLNDGGYNPIGDYVTENTKAYFKFFEDMYKDSEFFSANALGASREYEHFKDFPEIYNIYRKFAFDFYSNKYVLKENHSKDMAYNIPLWYVPVLAAFIRVLYFNKKLDKISTRQFLESVSVEMHSVIFNNLKFMFRTDPNLGNPDTLELLYRFDIGILYEINARYIGFDDPVIIPCIPSANALYCTCITQFRQSSYGSFFTHVIEVYWKSTWKTLREDHTYQTVRNHYTYDTKPLSLIITDRETEAFINNRILDKSHSRFNIISDTFDKIDACLEKCTIDKELNKCFNQIGKIAESYLSKIKDYDKNTLFPLVDQIYRKLEQSSLSQKNIIICYADKKIMYADYSRAFHNIFGIYDMAAIAIKYILRDKSLPDKNKYKLLKTQILPQLKTRNKTDCFNHLRMEYINFHHNLQILNISPTDFQTDLQEMQQLFSIFQDGCSPTDREDGDLCGQFDRLVENIISLCADKDNCFSYIFQISAGDM